MILPGVPRYPGGMPKVAWICGSCAADLGGGWSKGHCATFHVGECGVCKRQRAVTTPSDYLWNGCRGGNCE